VPWSQFWIERARRAADRRNRAYGLEVSPAIGRALAGGRLGFGGSLRLIAYVVFGSPWQLLRLLWLYLTDRDTPTRVQRLARLAADLSSVVGPTCRVAMGSFERGLYRRDLARVPRLLAGLLYRTVPLCVAQPRTEVDLLAIVRFAADRRLPIYPRGVSSSAFGGAVPTRNGLVIDLSLLSAILGVDPASATCRVQAGVRWADLAAHLEAFALAPRTTPSSRFSTVGGWAATGGLGLEGYRYGAFTDAIVAARVVVPDGRLLVLGAADERLRDFIGTEGQLGIFAELTLRLRPRPALSRPRLVHFDDLAAALDFVQRLVASGGSPAHVAVFDRARLCEENTLFRDRTGRVEPIVPEHDAVLLHFDEAATEAAFDEAKLVPAEALAPELSARYLWSERYFPLKAQRLGPGLLACEVVLPVGEVEAFVRRARQLARRFGSDVTIEANVSRTSRGPEVVVIAGLTCDHRLGLDYLLRLLLVQLMTHVAVARGGRPYGIGVWNAPFVRSRYSAAERDALAYRKRELDPLGILNPGKFFRVRPRRLGLALGLLLRPAVYGAALHTLRGLSPLIGALARSLAPPRRHDGWQVPSSADDNGRLLLRETAARCTFCGACVSTCPAYLVTGDERVTGRAKLQLAETLGAGQAVAAPEAQAAFQCLACGLCEEVCQARLPLRDGYAALERWIEAGLGRPTKLVAQFVLRVDAERPRLIRAYGLALPAWAPGQATEAEGPRAEDRP
jgi:glycolate oxidase